ncbi:MAG: hypothetical protein ACR2K5_11260 [Pseudolabrys sp.]
MRAILAIVAITAILTAPAYGQSKNPKPVSPQQQAFERQKKEAEDAYRAAMKNTAPAAAKADSDPWANARTPATKGK